MSTPQKANDTDVEIIDADTIADDDLDSDDGEDLVIPPDPMGEEDDDEAPSAKTKEDNDDEGEDPKEEEEDDDEDPDEDDDESDESDEDQEPDNDTPDDSLQKELKPVPGETPKERALRVKLHKTKKLLRQAQAGNITKHVKAPEETPITDEEYQELLEIYDEDEIAKMGKFVSVIARKQGFVRKDEIVADQGNKVLNDFIAANPQYDPENDPEDKNWNTFTTILERDYNYRGKGPEDLKVIFAKVHRDVNKELGIKTDKRAEIEIEKRKIEAKRSNIRAANLSGGAGGSKKTTTDKSSGDKPKKTIDPAVRGMFKGFDDEDFDD